MLRIILMLFVVGEHIVYTQKSLLNVGSIDYYIGNLYRSFSICAVNCFVIISGYFGIHFKMKKMMHLIVRIFMYSTIIFTVFTISGIHQVELVKDILLVAPVFTQRYWFITMYVVLCIMSPILNLAIKHLNLYNKRKIVIILILLFYIYPSISNCLNAPCITKDAGYGIVNFICLYLIGAYLREEKIISARKEIYFLGYVISSLLLFFSNHVLTLILGFPFNSFINYNTVFTMTSAVFLFLFFRKMEFNNSVINLLSKSSFWVFVLHAHPLVWKLFFDVSKGYRYSLHGMEYICLLFVIPILVYLIVFLIDNIYELTLKKIEDSIVEKIIENKIIKQCERFLVEFEESDY